MRDGDLSSGSVRVEVERSAASQQSLQKVIVSALTHDTPHPEVFTLSITVNKQDETINFVLDKIFTR